MISLAFWKYSVLRFWLPMLQLRNQLWIWQSFLCKQWHFSGVCAWRRGVPLPFCFPCSVCLQYGLDVDLSVMLSISGLLIWRNCVILKNQFWKFFRYSLMLVPQFLHLLELFNMVNFLILSFKSLDCFHISIISLSCILGDFFKFSFKSSYF